MFSLISWSIFFAGLWGQIWGLSWPVLAIAGLVLLAVFSNSIPIVGPFLYPLRKWLFVLAGIIFAYLVGEVRGVQVSDAKWEARAAVVKKKVDDTVKTSPLGDPKWTDPNNSPDN